jgi:hypothetical protein
VKSLGAERFWQAYYSLPSGIKESARAAHQKFLQNPAHPSLQLERLHSDPRFWSVRVTRDYRAVPQRFEGDVWFGYGLAATRNLTGNFPMKVPLNGKTYRPLHRQAPEDWRTPRRFAQFVGHPQTPRVLDCGGPPPLFPRHLDSRSKNWCFIRGQSVAKKFIARIASIARGFCQNNLLENFNLQSIIQDTHENKGLCR